MGQTKYVLKEKDDVQSKFDDVIENTEQSGQILITTNIKSFTEIAYYEIYVDDNLVTNTPDFTIKNTKDFCFGNYE